MNIAEYCIRRRTVTLVLLFVVLLGGVKAYMELGRLEDPEFQVKDAVVITPYPGATAMEVAEEVTDALETEIQQLPQLDEVKSLSKPGLSIITVSIKDKYDKHTIPQVWDELRRRVGEARSDLPPGAGPPVVNDNFGDVYGILFTISGRGYNYEDLKTYVKFLRKELLQVRNVAKIEIWGAQQEAIFLDFSHLRMAELGLAPEVVVQALAGQNLVQPSGEALVGRQRLAIRPTGDFLSVDDIANLQVSAPSSGRIIRVRDVARVSRGHVDPPDRLLRYNGLPAISLGISIVPGGNVVELGEAVQAKLDELEPYRPVGMEFGIVNFQPEDVTNAVNGFIINFVESLGIVIVVLLLFMGLRSGMLIGGVLVLTVLGSMIVMDLFSINLQRISLGALVISLGMLVDNAIVVTEGMLVRISWGEDKLRVAREVVARNAMPLLGATVIAVLAFAAIGGAQSSAGEFCRSLFYVICISLMLSWVLAITATPVFGHMLFAPRKATGADDEEANPYGGAFFRAYRRFLGWTIRRRWTVLAMMVLLLVVSVMGFGTLKNSFFPPSSRPQFQIHYWLPAGSDITATSADMARIEEHLLKDDRVQAVTSFIGAGPTRFTLAMHLESSLSKSYGLTLINVHDYKDIDAMVPELQDYLAETFPNAEPKVKKFALGPPTEGVEARFSGPDPEVLRSLAERAKTILRAEGGQGVRHDWRQKVKIVRPQFNETLARRMGVTRQAVHGSLQTAYSGSEIGVYREGDELIPIVARLDAALRGDVGRIEEVHVWSDGRKTMLPLDQVISGFSTDWEETYVRRLHRKPTITASAEPRQGELPSQLLGRVQSKIEAIELPIGYSLEWGGEYESSTEARTALSQMIPITLLGMVLIVVMLFNSLKQTAIIWLTVPLAIIGVSLGLVLFDLPFDFMATLGFLSLIGMLIKNAIVLIDQINLERAHGSAPLEAVLDSGVSRLRPVCMTAVTTVFGMFPLLQDNFFVSMAVTIMFGLAFATVLTLIVVPVLYAVFYRVPAR